MILKWCRFPPPTHLQTLQEIPYPVLTNTSGGKQGCDHGGRGHLYLVSFEYTYSCIHSFVYTPRVNTHVSDLSWFSFL